MVYYGFNAKKNSCQHISYFLLKKLIDSQSKFDTVN